MGMLRSRPASDGAVHGAGSAIGETGPQAGSRPSERQMLYRSQARRDTPVGRHWVDAFDRERLIRLRKQAGLSQHQLAEALYLAEVAGQDPQPSLGEASRRIQTKAVSVTTYETGRHSPTGATLFAIATALGADVLDLLVEGTRPTLAMLRARVGLTQGEVGPKLGRSRGWLGHVEQGRRDLTADEITALAAVLQATPAQIRDAVAALQATDAGEPAEADTRG
jgi:transcriptional regulator with XRE-family HTH domain